MEFLEHALSMELHQFVLQLFIEKGGSQSTCKSSVSRSWKTTKFRRFTSMWGLAAEIELWSCPGDARHSRSKQQSYGGSAGMVAWLAARAGVPNRVTLREWTERARSIPFLENFAGGTGNR